VNTGMAVIGNVGAGAQRSFTVIGDFTNVVARLQALSAPGTITVFSRTMDRLDRTPGVAVEARSLGHAELKGRAEATEAFELLSVTRTGGP
jgi:class 3 adenylate cyclase